MTRQLTAYISGALSGISDEEGVRLRAFYERLAEVCRKSGLDPYLPHLNSDPIKAAHLTPRQVDEMDRRRVSEADFVIAYVGIPSTGVGIEIEIARQAEVPVVLLYEKEKLRNRGISRLGRGNPAITKELAFASLEEAESLLAEFLLTVI